MSKRRQIITAIGIFVAVAAAGWTVPASASDARKASAGADLRSEKVAPPSAKRIAAHARSKPRLVRRQQLAHVASLYPTGCGWSYGGCERQFPLIIGIGF
jgi:hypothetical protein